MAAFLHRVVAPVPAPAFPAPPPPTPKPTPAPTPAPGSGCSPSYPSVCIPPPPPDLDCPQISLGTSPSGRRIRMDSTAIMTGLAARPRRMFRRVIKWALIALGALFIIGTVSNLVGANDPESVAAADAYRSRPTATPEPTIEATPDPTPESDSRADARADLRAERPRSKRRRSSTWSTATRSRSASPGRSYTVRYIGIDTPETVAPNSPVMWMGPEASAANARVGRGADGHAGARRVGDRQVRSTAALRVAPDGCTAGCSSTRSSSAWAMRLRRRTRPTFATRTASSPPSARRQTAGRGLWGPTPGCLSRRPSPATAPLPVAGNCDPSYPGVCIPPAPPDLDCGDITFRRFQVVAPDPHGFDGDHDGIGCES